MEKKNLIERLRMPQTELERYYRRQRLENFKAGTPIPGIRWRTVSHKIIRRCLRLSRVFDGRNIHVLDNPFVDRGKPVIFACTHVGRYDIETAFEMIPGSCFLFMGDPGGVYKSIDGLLLWLNGILFTDTADPTDRQIGKENCIKVLRQGGSVLIYPEGAWNISENQIVMPLFPGTAEMAIRTGAEIVPMAIEQYGKEYYVKIGKNISPAGYAPAEKRQLTAVLRDTLCTLKWDIMQEVAPLERGKLPENASELFLEHIMSQTENGYTLDVILRTRYHEKTTSPAEAFAHLQTLTPTAGNAFLFGKTDETPIKSTGGDFHEKTESQRKSCAGHRSILRNRRCHRHGAGEKGRPACTGCPE